MKDVKVDITPQEKASRIELLIRFVYMIPLFIVMWVLSIIAVIGIVINFVTSLVLGKRIDALSKFISVYIKYYTKMTVYLYLTDERPPIIPEDM